MQQGDVAKASVVLAKLRGKTDLVELQAELDEIQANILWHKQNSIRSVRAFVKEKALWSRLWRSWALSFLQQMSGAGGIRYYLPTNFIAAGTSKDISLLASGIDGTVQVACTLVAMFFIDRMGRKHALGIGAVIMAFCLMVGESLPALANDGCRVWFLTLTLHRSMALCSSRIPIRRTRRRTTATYSSFSSSPSDVSEHAGTLDEVVIRRIANPRATQMPWASDHAPGSTPPR